MNTATQTFAVITVKAVTPPDGDYRNHYITCGHTTDRCPSINVNSGRIFTPTLAEYMEQNEYFDGEIVYASPFRCRTCHTDLCDGAGGPCRSILEQCSKHSAAYQRRHGRAANE
jgi:hypothetical protein